MSYDDPTPIVCQRCGDLIHVALMSDHRAAMYRINPTCSACKDEASRKAQKESSERAHGSV